MVPHSKGGSHPDEPESQEMKTSNEPESIYGIGLVVSRVPLRSPAWHKQLTDWRQPGVGCGCWGELLAVNKSVHEVKDLIAVRIQRRLCKRIRNPDVRRGAQY